MMLPEENELVLVKVKKILPYGAFCELIEFNNIEAFMHVSEVAPRWIKNIHEFLSEGQMLVVKVIRVDESKNQIDVSLKRVSEEEKRKKLEMVRRKKRCEKIIEFAIKKAKSSMKVEEVMEKLEDEFGEAYSALEEILEDENALEDVKIPKTLKKQLIEITKKSIKRRVVCVRKDIKLTSIASNGVERIKKILGLKEKGVKVLYIGGPVYRIEVEAKEYKEANKKMEKIINEIKKKLTKDEVLEVLQ